MSRKAPITSASRLRGMCQLLQGQWCRSSQCPTIEAKVEDRNSCDLKISKDCDGKDKTENSRKGAAGRRRPPTLVAFRLAWRRRRACKVFLTRRSAPFTQALYNEAKKRWHALLHGTGLEDRNYPCGKSNTPTKDC